MRTSLVAVLGGSALCVGGVFLLHFGIYSALILGTASMLVSVGNACLPALNGQMALPAPAEAGAVNDTIKEGSPL